MPRTLTLVKHARPEKLEGVDSHNWPLSPQGRADVEILAGKLAASGRTYCVCLSSDEPKASETASLLAARMGLPHASDKGLGEHDRTGVELMKTPEFVSAIALLFARPTQLVLGNETARQALKRFDAALFRLLETHPEGDVLVVSHGTVLALWLEHYADLDGYRVWREMGLPSYVAVSWPDCKVLERLDRLPGT